ncbi:sensor histidine kinase [Leptolyngbya sp. NIES-2104]|uniref:sensor histidine kinase n=1 Tax=Leptolyngbya sp. NIES-2104 TaxID=1552121 RepID=UPI0006ECAA34|nr:ATP-binding protein [Leptolyngbya sp. NIES-2104]GAP97519.1 circadian input kinase A [Leptolyngbya sp. NIES-2104]
MNALNLTFTPELFSKFFPFHLVFNDQQEIIQAGEVIQRVNPVELLNSDFDQHFCINRPKISFEIGAIRKHEKSLFLLESLHTGMQLKGQMICLNDPAVVLFIGSPWVTETKSLEPFGLKLKDFAIHDPVVDFLFLLQSQNAALADTKKLADELRNQRVQLQSALQIKENLATLAEAQARKLEQTLIDLQKAQAQLVQTEKMSSLGQLVAGVAHEINNPVSFIFGNLQYAEDYIEDLVHLIQLYQRYYSEPYPLELQQHLERSDLDFALQDLPKLLHSMRVGCDRIRNIVLSLRTFSRLDEAEVKPFNIHDGIDSTLMILQSRLKADSHRPAIEVIKHYGDLPLVECNGGQLNQVFMNLISNAIDALEEQDPERWQTCPGRISITTTAAGEHVLICIADNGTGMTEEVKSRLFDPFFTTKPIGRGTGLGLSISYQIVTDKHAGEFWCESECGKGAAFWIKLPLTFEPVNTQATAVQEILLASV